MPFGKWIRSLWKQAEEGNSVPPITTNGSSEYEAFWQWAEEENSLIGEFKSFWKWAKKEEPQNLLSRLGEHWVKWWSGQLFPSEWERIQELGEDPNAQKEFIKWVCQWAKQLPRHRQAGNWFLASLARTPPFDGWSSLNRYRTLENLPANNAVILGKERGGGKEDIRRLVTVLVPKLAPGDLDCHIPGVMLLDDRDQPEKSARVTPQRALESVFNMLKGSGLWRLMIRWLVFGRKPGREGANWFLKALKYGKRFSLSPDYSVGLHTGERRLLKYVGQLTVSVGWIVVIGILLFFLSTPGETFADNTIIVPWAYRLIWVSLALVLWSCVSAIREVIKAWRQGRRWARLLQESQVCALVSEPPAAPVEGPSFGVVLSLSILQALDEADPVTDKQSRFWRSLLDQLKLSASTWAITGEAHGDKVGAVNRLKDKYQAALDHQGIAVLATPDQKEAASLLPVTKRKLNVEREIADLPPESERKRSVGLAPAFVAQAAGVSELRLRPYGRIAKLCMDIGRFNAALPVGRFNINTAIVMNAIHTLLLVVAVTVWSDIRRLEYSPRDPVLSGALAKSGTLQLVIKTNAPTLFAASFTSDYWANRPVKQFGSTGHADIELERLKNPRVNKLFDGSVELIRLRQFLWRELPPTRMAKVPLGYLINPTQSLPSPPPK